MKPVFVIPFQIFLVKFDEFGSDEHKGAAGGEVAKDGEAAGCGEHGPGEGSVHLFITHLRADFTHIHPGFEQPFPQHPQEEVGLPHCQEEHVAD